MITGNLLQNDQILEKPMKSKKQGKSFQTQTALIGFLFLVFVVWFLNQKVYQYLLHYFQVLVFLPEVWVASFLWKQQYNIIVCSSKFYWFISFILRVWNGLFWLSFLATCTSIWTDLHSTWSWVWVCHRVPRLLKRDISSRPPITSIGQMLLKSL